MVLGFRCEIALCVIAVTIVQPQYARAEAKLDKTAIAVVPISDGSLDDESAKLSAKIAESLKLTDKYHVMDSKLTADVLEYYERSDAPLDYITEAEGILAKAKDDYFEFRYAEASSGVSRAINFLKEEGKNISETGPLLVDAYVTQAIIAKSKGNIAATKEALKSALRINPRLEFSPENYPPSLILILEYALRELLSGPVGEIRISTKPKAAEVRINGVAQGSSPLVLKNMPVGTYQLSINENKYERITRQIQIEANRATEVSEKLKWSRKKGEAKQGKANLPDICVREGLRISEIMKLGKVVLLDVDGKGGAKQVEARIVDAKFRAGLPAISVEVETESDWAQKYSLFVRTINRDLEADLAAGPQKLIEPKGEVIPFALNKRRKEFYKSPIFWGIVGTILAGGVGAGVLLSTSGENSPGTGNLRVEFR